MHAELAVVLLVVCLLSLFSATEIPVMGWIGIGALMALCLMVITWGLDRALRELLGKP